MGAYDDWIGRTETTEARLAPEVASMMHAALRDEAPAPGALDAGAPMPALWHWATYFPAVPLSALGRDGHPAKGGFLPPVPLDRRMWAGGRLVFHDARLKIGEPFVRVSEILKISEKDGAAGPMVFVTVGHRLATDEGLAIEEEQDIVYIRMPEAFRPPKPIPSPRGAAWTEEVDCGPVRLFRYSAATFNGHLIHYDRAYASEVEKYPGLVVQGPFQATLLLEAAMKRRPGGLNGAPPRRLSQRGVRPMFDFHPLTLMEVKGGGEAGTDGSALNTADPEGNQGYQLSVEWT